MYFTPKRYLLKLNRLGYRPLFRKGAYASIDFVKVLSNNSWLERKGRPFATYVARARPRYYVARELRSTCKSNASSA